MKLTADMDHRKERMKSDCKKIMDSINAMCFENLNDEQVHSLVMMREIARGVVENRAGKVSGSDVKKALSSSIDKMVSLFLFSHFEMRLRDLRILLNIFI